MKHPGFIYKISQYQRAHGVAYDTARTDMLELAEKLGFLLKEKRGRSYIFRLPQDLINRIPNQDKSLSMLTFYFSNIVSKYIERSDVSIDIIISNSTIIQNILRNMSFNDLTLFHQSIVYQNPSRINSKNRSSYIENLVYEKYLNGNGSEEINKSILYYAVNVIQSRLPINVEEKLKIDSSDWKEYVNMMKTVRVKIKS